MNHSLCGQNVGLATGKVNCNLMLLKFIVTQVILYNIECGFPGVVTGGCNRSTFQLL